MSEALKHIDDYDTETRFAATIVSSERITSDESDEEVRELVLDVERGDLEFRAGQSLAVIAPGASEFGGRDHIRFYSVADLPARSADGKPQIKICVRRCSYIDEYSGEEFPGVASHYLCNASPGEKITMAGPFGIVFNTPEELDANVILIGTGTGIAPFRAFVKNLYKNVDDWSGRVLLFYGAKSGLELLYMNEKKNDFTQYYDEETFEAFQALSPRPGWANTIDWNKPIAERGEELWRLFGLSNTYVYVAGLEKMIGELDKVFTGVAGSEDKWERRKAELIAGRRWVELTY